MLDGDTTTAKWRAIISGLLLTTLPKNYHWYTLNEQIQNKRIDMLVIDGPPAHLNHYARYPAGHLLLPLLNENGAVFLDDVDRHDEQEIIQRWVSEFKGLDVRQYDCEKGVVSFLIRKEVLP